VNRLSRHWPWLALIAAAALLAIAHAFETFGHLAPCELCLKQRAVYWAVIGVCLVGLLTRRLIGRMDITRLINIALIVVFALEAGIAVYHAGVEWKWWPGPLSCSGGATRVDPEALRRLLSGQSMKVVSCDQPAWVFLGLSMAGWNAVAAGGLTLISAVAAFGRRKPA
jgi:disulfide bond formation protein DsbB